jgi:uncharacterized delta-60 repeat protein
MGKGVRGDWLRDCAAISLAFALLAPAAANAKTPLVHSFGRGGIALTRLGEHAQRNRQWMTDMVVEPSEMIVFGAQDPRGGFTLERLRPDGTLDPSFGGDGQVATAIRANSMAVAPSGAIVVAGFVGEGVPGQDVAVMRYRPDGRVDRSFGRAGLVRLDEGLRDGAEDVLLQPDGTIVVASSSWCIEKGDPNCRWWSRFDIALTRLRAGGKVISTRRFQKAKWFVSSAVGKGGQLAMALDFLGWKAPPRILRLDPKGVAIEGFGDAGTVPAGKSGDSGAIRLQDDGKLVLAGFGLHGGGLFRLEADGDVDAAFAENGAAICTPTGALFTSEAPPRVALFPDGRLLAGGGLTDCGLVRYQADGAPDPSFDGDGKVDPKADVGGPPTAIATGPRETAVIASWESGAGFRLARYLADGSLDPSFGSGGTTVVPSASATLDQANALLVLPGGKLLAVGTAACADRSCGEFALARYKQGGKLDRRFGRAGLVTTDPGGVGLATAAAVQPNGRIVVVGGSGERSYGELVQEQLTAIRYLPNGRLDPSFGNGGIVTIPSAPGENVQANDVAIARNGDIVVVGGASCEDSERCGDAYCSECGEFVVALIRPNGAMARSFDRDGVLRVDVGHSPEDHDAARAVAIESNGRIVVAGRTYLGGFGLLRLTPDGRMDPTFGRRGIVRTRFYVKLRDDKGKAFRILVHRPATSLALTENGRIVVAGGTDFRGRQGRYRNHGAVVRYLHDGTIDRRFGRGGKVDTGHLAVNALALDRCGRLVLAGGFNGRKGVDHFGVSRRLPGGAPDRSFARGVAQLHVGSGEDSFANGVALSRSAVVAAGVGAREGAGTDFALVAFRDHGDCRH